MKQGFIVSMPTWETASAGAKASTAWIEATSTTCVGSDADGRTTCE